MAQCMHTICFKVVSVHCAVRSALVHLMCGHRWTYIGCFTTNLSLPWIRFQSQNFPLYKHLFILHGCKSQSRANMSRRVWFVGCAAKWNPNCCCKMELEVIMCVLIVRVTQGSEGVATWLLVMLWFWSTAWINVCHRLWFHACFHCKWGLTTRAEVIDTQPGLHACPVESCFESQKSCFEGKKH